VIGFLKRGINLIFSKIKKGNNIVFSPPRSEKWGIKSKSLNIIEALKDNYDFLINCKNHDYILKKAKELGII